MAIKFLGSEVSGAKPPVGFRELAFNIADQKIYTADSNGLIVEMSSRGFDKTYYIDDVTGSDTNSGLSPANAFKTVDKAIDKAIFDKLESLKIYLAPGTYAVSSSYVFDFLTSVSIIGDSKSTTTLNLNGRTFDFITSVLSSMFLGNVTITGDTANFRSFLNKIYMDSVDAINTTGPFAVLDGSIDLFVQGDCTISVPAGQPIISNPFNTGVRLTVETGTPVTGITSVTQIAPNAVYNSSGLCTNIVTVGFELPFTAPTDISYVDAATTPAEIKTRYESNADTNAFTDAQQTLVNLLSGTTPVNLDVVVVDGDIGVTVQPYDINTVIDASYVQTEENFTTVEKLKLAGIEDGATADQTGAEIKALYEAELDTNAFTDALLSKLNGIEPGATADQTGAEIKVLYEAELDTNAFTDALLSKLNGIEAGATGDQTALEIKTLYESNLDTNAFTDALLTKLNGIEAGATADQLAVEVPTDTTNFDVILSATESDVQKALDVLDSHVHDGTGGGVSYELADPTILKSADIGVTVQPYDANTVIDALYVHTDENFTTLLKNKLDAVLLPTDVVVSTALASYTPDFAASNYFEYTLDRAGVVLNNPLNITKGQRGKIIIRQDATGGWTGLTYGTLYVFPLGEPVLDETAFAVNELNYTVVEQNGVLEVLVYYASTVITVGDTLPVGGVDGNIHYMPLGSGTVAEYRNVGGTWFEYAGLKMSGDTISFIASNNQTVNYGVTLAGAGIIQSNATWVAMDAVPTSLVTQGYVQDALSFKEDALPTEVDGTVVGNVLVYTDFGIDGTGWAQSTVLLGDSVPINANLTQNIIGAINDNYAATVTNATNISTNTSAIGTLASLNTTVQTDLVSAINELEGNRVKWIAAASAPSDAVGRDLDYHIDTTETYEKVYQRIDGVYHRVHAMSNNGTLYGSVSNVTLVQNTDNWLVNYASATSDGHVTVNATTGVITVGQTGVYTMILYIKSTLDANKAYNLDMIIETSDGVTPVVETVDNVFPQTGQVLGILKVSFSRSITAGNTIRLGLVSDNSGDVSLTNLVASFEVVQRS